MPGVSPTSFLSPSLTELAARPSAFRLLAKVAFRHSNPDTSEAVHGAGNFFHKYFFVVTKKFRGPLLIVLLASKKYSGLSNPDESQAVGFLHSDRIQNTQEFPAYFVFCRSAGIRTRSHLVPNQTC